MQYQVDRMDQTQENGQLHSWWWPTFYASHEKNSQKSTKIFLDMQFSQGVHQKAEFLDSMIKYN